MFKKIILLILSIILAVVCVGTLFAILDSHAIVSGDGNVLLGFVWESETVTNLMQSWEVETRADFAGESAMLLLFVCIVLFIICATLGDSVMRKQKQYSGATAYRLYTYQNLLLIRLAGLAIIATGYFIIMTEWGREDGSWTPFIFMCIFFGIPTLIFALVTLSKTFHIIIMGRIKHSFCKACNHGSLRQNLITHAEYLFTRATVETTTTKRDGKVVDVKSRTTSSVSFYRNTYTCVNCRNEYTMVEAGKPRIYELPDVQKSGDSEQG
jgi:hypothetical protein